jgi:radical SAM protein with 4Fe4S-binding SPASM domain
MHAEPLVRAPFPDAPPLPTYLQLEPVGQCNLRCRMCAIQFRRDGPPHGPLAFMPFDDFRRIVAAYPALEHLHLQGLGEPTMHPRFFDMVGWASGRGLHVTTNSNMTLLSERRVAQMMDSGLAELHMSLDAATPAIYESIRVGAHFHKVLRNVRRVVAARAATGARLRLRIVTVLMRENLPDLPNLVRLAADEGVNELFVQQLCHDFDEASLPAHYRPMRVFIDGQRLAAGEDDRVAAIFAEARDTASTLGVELRLPRRAGHGAPRGLPRCDWPWTGAYVSYSGEGMPCCMVGTPDRARFGNVIEDGVERVWSNTAARSFRAALASDRPPAVCRTCALYRGTF